MNQYNDIRSTDRSALAAAQDAFFRSGGKVEEIEAYQFKPKPPRTEVVVTPEEQAKLEFVEQVRKLGETMTKTQIVMRLGVSMDRIHKACRDNNITCVMGTGKRPESRGSKIDPEADARMVERIRALAEVGLSKSKSQHQAGISWDAMKRLVNTYGIEFKK